jgi:hypothetical protein
LQPAEADSQSIGRRRFTEGSPAVRVLPPKSVHSCATLASAELSG